MLNHSLPEEKAVPGLKSEILGNGPCLIVQGSHRVDVTELLQTLKTESTEGRLLGKTAEAELLGRDVIVLSEV